MRHRLTLARRCFNASPDVGHNDALRHRFSVFFKSVLWRNEGAYERENGRSHWTYFEICFYASFSVIVRFKIRKTSFTMGEINGVLRGTTCVQRPFISMFYVSKKAFSGDNWKCLFRDLICDHFHINADIQGAFNTTFHWKLPFSDSDVLTFLFLCYFFICACKWPRQTFISPKMRPHASLHLCFVFRFYFINILTFEKGLQLTNKNGDSVSYIVMSCEMSCACSKNNAHFSKLWTQNIHQTERTVSCEWNKVLNFSNCISSDI